jgi:hypothetical protein
VRFRSAIDVWLLLVFACTTLLVLVALVPLLASGAILLAALILASAVGLPAWLLLSTWYEVDEELLLVRSGPFNWRIRRCDISAVRPTRSVLSSPALSLDRLEIEYGNGRRILVSPANRQSFVETLGFPDAT